MTRYEYKVIPSPAKGQKAPGVKTPEGRFALSVEAALNEMAAQGWEYQRAELLPSEERSGLTGSATHWRTVLVFRRALAEAEEVAGQPRFVSLPEARGQMPLPEARSETPSSEPRPIPFPAVPRERPRPTAPVGPATAPAGSAHSPLGSAQRDPVPGGGDAGDDAGND